MPTAQRCFLALLPGLATGLFAQEPTFVHHALTVRVQPDAHRIEVIDELTIPAALRRGGVVRFRLHAALELDADLDGNFDGFVVESTPVAPSSRVRTYTLRARDEDWPDAAVVRLRYAGELHDPLVADEPEYAQSQERTSGLVDARGVVLSGSSFWVPEIDGAFVTFRVEVALPDGWSSVSQGRRVAPTTWDCPEPMDEIYLLAGRWHEFERSLSPGVTAYAFLGEPDDALAARYLDATGRNLEMYAGLIGPYPYAKFALVENFWETGYGMPSFTLLGSQVIRLPFIVDTSYPHEILHNWWGNSVFVDAAGGNWCEGLTAYLADHLIAEGQGRGAEYRRDALQRYRDYVQSGADFPLVEFRSRHSAATQAVGYGKALMLFHMLRRELGDDVFVRGLRDLYREQRFRRAAWSDLAAAFGAAAERDLGGFFAQWLERSGAPELVLDGVEVQPGDGGAERVQLTLRQVQDGTPYALRVPVAVVVAGLPEARVEVLELDAAERTFTIDVSGSVRALHVDPEFDLFRRLDRREVPASLGQLFGAAHATIVLPKDSDPLADAWREFAATWQAGSRIDIAIVEEDAIDALPQGRAVWVLGSTNRWADSVRAAARPPGVTVDGEDLTKAVEGHPDTGGAFVLCASHPTEPELAIAWIGADRVAALPGLARKLPHYGKYSLLTFRGDEPAIVIKQQGSVVDSPLVWRRDRSDVAPAVLPAREPLARTR